MELGTPGLALKETVINTDFNSHGLMRHTTDILELLNKTDDNEMCFIGGLSGCHVCADGKNIHRVHPEEATTNVNNAGKYDGNDDNNGDVVYNHENNLSLDILHYTSRPEFTQ